MGGRGRGFGRGRKLSAEELQLVLMALMEAGPVHGYDLIQQIDERSGGYYVPSPGVIYPALTYLAEAGHADVTKDGNRKLYSLTNEGKAHLSDHREDASAILERLGQIAERMDNVRAAFSGEDEIDAATQARFEAFRSLKRAVKARRGCGQEQAEKITSILQRAADDIAALD